MLFDASLCLAFFSINLTIKIFILVFAKPSTNIQQNNLSPPHFAIFASFHQDLPNVLRL